LVGKPEEKRSLRKPRSGWENNVKMAIKEIGFEIVDWIQLAQDAGQWWALVNTVMNRWVS
jgi:hypothetical protein